MRPAYQGQSFEQAQKMGSTQNRFETTLKHSHSHFYESGWEAERRWSDTARTSTDARPGRAVSNWHVHHANSVLGRLAEKRFDYNSASVHYKCRLQAASDMWGRNDPDTLRIANSLATLLRRWFMDDEAAEVEAKFGGPLGSGSYMVDEDSGIPPQFPQCHYSRACASRVAYCRSFLAFVYV